MSVSLNCKYIENGKPETVVFLHGIGGNHRIFKAQVDDFSQRFNLLMVDMHSHGESANIKLSDKKDITFESVADDILHTMDSYGIESAHLIGTSLGTMVISAMIDVAPERILSATLSGAILGYKLRTKFLFFTGNLLRGIVPYMWLYAIFAYAMMPRRHHAKSRKIFVREAAKLGEKEFFAWFDLMQSWEDEYDFTRLSSNRVPKCYLLGKEDHMFTSILEDYLPFDTNARLEVFENCGHVSNIDAAERFNVAAIEFILSHTISHDVALLG